MDLQDWVRSVLLPISKSAPRTSHDGQHYRLAVDGIIERLAYLHAGERVGRRTVGRFWERREDAYHDRTRSARR